MTRIRKMMLEELQRRNYSSETIRAYINAVKQYAEYFHCSPEKLGPQHVREYQLHRRTSGSLRHTLLRLARQRCGFCISTRCGDFTCWSIFPFRKLQ